MKPLHEAPVLVVGAGIMGAGIAQIAAQAGHRVLLHDARPGAAADAIRKTSATLQQLVAKGKLSAHEAEQATSRLLPIDRFEDAGDVGLVIEAIVEQLQAKRELFARLEDVVASDCVLASNTSSISITALARGLRHPGRLVGMHFFNPVPLMKLVEVVSGLHTDAQTVHAIEDISRRWGKTPVHAKSTPGFIVNRIARPYYAEALALLQEQAASPATLDACLRAAGFRMGPCELMDLIGHDTNFAVTCSVYESNFGDKRYTPSLVQRELVDGGLLGRKSGRGFYDYREGVAIPDRDDVGASRGDPPYAQRVVVHGNTQVSQGWCEALERVGMPYAREPGSKWTGVEIDNRELRLTDGRTATELAAKDGCIDCAVFDLPVAGFGGGRALAWAVSETATNEWRRDAASWLRLAGFAPRAVRDAAGLVVARTIAMLINEAADAVQQGVCTPEGADLAMKLGVNYPCGPFEWLAGWHAADIVALLDRLDSYYRGERYRVSPWLRRRAWMGMME